MVSVFEGLSIGPGSVHLRLRGRQKGNDEALPSKNKISVKIALNDVESLRNRLKTALNGGYNSEVRGLNNLKSP